MPTILDFANMANAVYESSPQVDGWTASNFRASRGVGLQAVTFTNGAHTVVAFKGTSELMDGVADLKLGIGMNTSYYSEAEQYIQRYANAPGVIVTGHSLGGAIAQTVGNRRQLPFVTFNAPGVAIMASQNITSINPIMGAIRVGGGIVSMFRHPMQAGRDIASAFYDVVGVNYRLSGDMISRVGLHYGPITDIHASGDALTQHKMATVLDALARCNTGYVQYP